jgi:alpha-acetolactate decarboxylase
MNKTFLLLLSLLISGIAAAEAVEVKSYGHYKKMIHMKNTDGVVGLKMAIPKHNSYAVGAIQDGAGEITVLNGKIYLDYGKDGMGNSIHTIPPHEKAVLLATSSVDKWQSTKIKKPLAKEDLFKAILSKAKEMGLDVKKPFPFLLEGRFKDLQIHVINGKNPKFGGHGSKEKMFHMAKQTKGHQAATIVGFYSADDQGTYTHPGESWHLHAIIDDIGAHVDEIHSGMNVVLKLPMVKIHDKRYSLGLDEAEKAEFLAEMRQMLTSIQQIMTGIATKDKDMIIKAARYSGNKMARATPQSVKDKTPVSFEQIGGPTHMMFEELIINVEEMDLNDQDDITDLAEFTGKLMRNCLACHAAFKVE